MAYISTIQSFAKPRNVRVLRTGYSPTPGAWFAVPASDDGGFYTPEWTFESQELKHF